jgi:hypothetical protein
MFISKHASVVLAKMQERKEQDHNGEYKTWPTKRYMTHAELAF